MLCNFCYNQLDISFQSTIQLCHTCLYKQYWEGDILCTEIFYYKNIHYTDRVCVSHKYKIINIIIPNVITQDIKYGDVKITPEKAKEIIYNYKKHNILR